METADRKTLARCPRCDTPLSDSVLGGQCPVCVVNLAQRIAAERDNMVHLPNPSAGITHVDTEALRYFGEFELLGEVGRGGMGVVYKARQLRLNRVVALKLIAPEQLASPKAVERFHTEAEAAANLDHPNIVPIYDTGTFEGRHYFTMKLVEGQSLEKRIPDYRLPIGESKSPLGPSLRSQLTARQTEIASLIATVADAVHYAHQRGILHRDLKPGNILIDTAGEPHVTDFGLAKRVEGENSLTLSGEVLGTPAYMAPEQAAGKTYQTTIAADVYSLGVVLYELLAGRPPFGGGTSLEVFHELLHKEPPSPRSFNRWISRDLETICLKCLEKEPARRYPSAQALADDLRHFIRGEPIQYRSITQPEKLWRWCRRKPAFAVTLLLLHLVSLAGLTGIVWQWHSAKLNAAELRRVAYASDIALAQEALRVNNLGRARSILNRQRPTRAEEDLRGFEWRYLWGLARGDELHTFIGHSNNVIALAISPDQTLLATAALDETIRIWNPKTFKLVTTLPSQGLDQFCSIAFVNNGREIAASDTNGATIWETATWQPAHRLKVSSPPVGAAFVISSEKGKALLIPTRTGVDVWDVTNWTVTESLTIDGLAARTSRAAVSVSADGSVLAMSSASDGIDLWGLRSRSKVAHLNLSSEPTTLAFSADGRLLAAGSSGGSLKLWDMKSVRELGTWVAHASWAIGLSFSPDGAVLATGGADQLIHLWSMQDFDNGPSTKEPKKLSTLRGHGDQVWALSFSDDGRLLLSGSQDTTAKLWSVEPKPPHGTLASHEEWTWLSGGNEQVVGELPNKTIGPWNASSGKIIRNARHHSSTEGGEEISPDGRSLVLVMTNGSFRFYSLPERSQRGEGSVGRLKWCLFSNNGRRFLTGSAEGIVRVWDVPSSRQLDQFEGEAPAKLSPDGRYVAAHGPNGVYLREIARRRNLAVLSEHRRGTRDVAFSPDGKLLATSGNDNAIRLWRVPSGEFVGVMEGHVTTVNPIAFLPDGRTLISVADHESVRFWNVATRYEMLSFPHLSDFPRQILFSIDGTGLAVAGSNLELDEVTKIVKRWNAPSWDEIAAKELQDSLSFGR